MEQSDRNLLRWPQSILGPRPGLKELNVFCWGLFVIGLIFPLSVVLFVRWKMGARFSSLLPVDFIYFYGIGQILNQHPAVQLYDYGLQLKTFNDIYPLTENHQVWGRSPYPPFVAKFFSMYARFSFEQAYFLWMGTSFALFIAGITAAIKAAMPRDPLRGSLIFCFALASPLFLYYNLVVGQLATIAVFSTGFAIYLERRSMPLLSGLALSILDLQTDAFAAYRSNAASYSPIQDVHWFCSGDRCVNRGINSIRRLAHLGCLCAVRSFLCGHSGPFWRIGHKTMGICRLQLVLVWHSRRTIVDRTHNSRFRIARPRHRGLRDSCINLEAPAVQRKIWPGPRR